MGHFSAFSVARHDSLLSTDGDEIITWDHVFVNALGDFAPESGIFTCCIPGKKILTNDLHFIVRCGWIFLNRIKLTNLAVAFAPSLRGIIFFSLRLCVFFSLVFYIPP